jgi:hypothetical protein
MREGRQRRSEDVVALHPFLRRSRPLPPDKLVVVPPEMDRSSPSYKGYEPTERQLRSARGVSAATGRRMKRNDASQCRFRSLSKAWEQCSHAGQFHVHKTPIISLFLIHVKQ